MKKYALIFLALFSFNAHTAGKDYSFSYLDLSVNYNDDISYEGELSLNIPSLPIYLKGNLEHEKTEVENAEFDKDSTTIALGVHGSVSDLVSTISSGGIDVNLKQILELYAELGFNKWELEDGSSNLEDGTDAYARAGIRMGDSTAWEYDLFVEKTKIASVYTDPETGSTKYSLSNETNNKIGLKVINHFGDNFSLNFGLSNDDFSGSSFSLGIRYSF
tara:strand:- start:100 stop:753 length:654 start_codon:yes stop_codon:yes gene_type:complete